MFIYEHHADVTYPHDTNPLMVTGFIKVYAQEGEGEAASKTYLTEIPFPKFPFHEVQDQTIEGFNTYVDTKVSALVNSEEWQNKLAELKLAYDLGVYVPAQ